MDTRDILVALGNSAGAEAVSGAAEGLPGQPLTEMTLERGAQTLQEPGTSDHGYNRPAELGAGRPGRSNAEWIAVLHSSGADQAAALAELRAYLLRAALFTLKRARHQTSHLGWGELSQLAEDCAQEAMTAVLQRLAHFRGDSRFTTWAYTFAVNIALVASRRERWARVPLERVLDGSESPAAAPGDEGASPDPERHALRAEAIAAIREGIEQHLTAKQQQALRAVVFEQIPLDEMARL